MGRPKLGKEYKKPSDYTYDYPANRQLGAQLSHLDLKLIAARTGYAYSYLRNILVVGNRTNKKVVAMAKAMAEHNKKIEKERNEILNSILQ